MERPELLSRLNEATDKAASFAIQRGFPIPSKKSGIWVGNTFIKKNKKGFYDVFTLDKELLFSDIMVFDVATIIAQRYTNGEFKTIEKILALEYVYAKHHTDMLHYLHCIRAAKMRHDYDTMAILEDKFQISEMRARKTRDSISVFKRVK
jgi:hypothetical protein